MIQNFKLFTLLTFISLFGFSAMAQDVIILKNGDEIKSLVQEIGTEYVKYKRFDNQTGPIYNMAKTEIFMVKYENGTKDVFNEVAKPIETKEASVQESTSVKNNENTETWTLYEPTKFVYAYFAFNSFYNHNWDESIRRGRLWQFRLKENVEGKRTYYTEYEKFISMIDFIFSNIEESDIEYFLKKLKRRKEDTIRIINGIEPDGVNIYEEDKKMFIEGLKILLNEENFDTSVLKEKIIPFIYGVRNNIFHGVKTFDQMIGVSQRERLDIYTIIIMDINELLFRVLEKEIQITLLTRKMGIR